MHLYICVCVLGAAFLGKIIYNDCDNDNDSNNTNNNNHNKKNNINNCKYNNKNENNCDTDHSVSNSSFRNNNHHHKHKTRENGEKVEKFFLSKHGSFSIRKNINKHMNIIFVNRVYLTKRKHIHNKLACKSDRK